MRKIMESMITETPIQVGDKVMYKGHEVEVVGVNPRDFGELLLRKGDWENWVRDDKVERIVSEIEEKPEDIEGFDAQTIAMLKQIKAKYPHAPDQLSAILKYVQRIVQHSEEEDNLHDHEFEIVFTRLEDIIKELDTLKKNAGIKK